MKIIAFLGIYTAELRLVVINLTFNIRKYYFKFALKNKSLENNHNNNKALKNLTSVHKKNI